MNDIHARLAQWNLALPPPSPPAANYAPYTLHAGILYVSGNVPLSAGVATHVGSVPTSISLDEAYLAAQRCALGILAQIGAALDGQFDRVQRVLKVTGLVSCDAKVQDLAKAINGASDVFVHVFGERGYHARTSFGVLALPRGVAVEVDATVAVV